MKPQVVHGFVEVEKNVWVNPHSVHGLDYVKGKVRVSGSVGGFVTTGSHTIPELLKAFEDARVQQAHEAFR